MGRRALIFGSTGQDGQLMRQLLERRGYKVFGSRRLDMGALVASAPTEIYCLGGLSSVAQSFENPEENYESNVAAAWRLLEAVRRQRQRVRVCFAGSSEALGDIPEGAATEAAPARPVSPYGYAKAMLRDLVASYRDLYGLYVCTAILFNHTSHLQRETYLVPRIVQQARQAARNRSTSRIVLGNVEVARDWGWAPDYVRAMQAMLAQPDPQDYVIATGTTHTLREVVEGVYSRMSLEIPEITVNQALLRPRDLGRTCGNPSLLRNVVGWNPVGFEQLLDYVVRPPEDIWAVNEAVASLA